MKLADIRKKIAPVHPAEAPPQPRAWPAYAIRAYARHTASFPDTEIYVFPE